MDRLKSFFKFLSAAFVGVINNPIFDRDFSNINAGFGLIRGGFHKVRKIPFGLFIAGQMKIEIFKTDTGDNNMLSLKKRREKDSQRQVFRFNKWLRQVWRSEERRVG